jgi:hypothetical protein
MKSNMTQVTQSRMIINDILPRIGTGYSDKPGQGKVSKEQL